MDNNVNLATLPLHLRLAQTEENMLVSPGFTERGRRRRMEEQRTSGTNAASGKQNRSHLLSSPIILVPHPPSQISHPEDRYSGTIKSA